MLARSQISTPTERVGELHLLSQWSEGLETPPRVLLDAQEPASYNLCRGSCNDHGWWTVTVGAMEAVRRVPDGAMPLTVDSLRRNAVPSSRLRVRVSWMDVGQGVALDADLGGGLRIAVEGPSVEVKVLGPASRTREVSRDPVSPMGSGGIYLDTLVSGHVVPSLSPVRGGPLTLTQVLRMPPRATTRSIPIPAFAQHLVASTPSVGLPLGPLWFRVGDGGPPLRRLGFQGGSTKQVRVPRQASHVSVASVPFRPFTLTLVWSLEL